jgi:Kelch motif
MSSISKYPSSGGQSSLGIIDPSDFIRKRQSITDSRSLKNESTSNQSTILPENKILKRIKSQVNNVISQLEELKLKALNADASNWDSTNIEEFIKKILSWTMNLDLPKELNACYLTRGNSLECYEPDFKKGFSVQFRKESRLNLFASLIKANEKVFIIGGMNPDEGYSNTVLVYNIEIGKFQNIAELNRKRACSAVVKVNDNIYIIGGCGESSQGHNTIEVLNCKSENIIKETVMKTPKKKPSACVYKGSIYIANHGPDQRIEKYSTDSDFSEFCEIKYRLSYVSMIGSNGNEIIVFTDKEVLIGDNISELSKIVSLKDPVGWSQNEISSFKNFYYFFDYFRSKFVTLDTEFRSLKEEEVE